MIVVNFTHRLAPACLARIAQLAGRGVDRVIDIPVQLALGEPIGPQCRALVDSAGLDAAEWETAPIAVALPSLSVAAAGVLAEIHGRGGHFPAVIAMRPGQDPMTPGYEVAEIVNLQALRDGARRTRS